MTPPTHDPTPSGSWRRVRTIVGEALDLPAGEREGFIDRACAGDAALRAQVSELVHAGETVDETLSDAGVPGSVLADALARTPIASGTTIGRYRVGSLLGSGGMGSIFEAWDTALSRRVAIKLLSVGVTSTASRRRFEAEAAALARLDHPGVAKVFEVGMHTAIGQAVTMPYFVMEYVEDARRLDTFVRETKPSVRDVLRLAAMICDADHHGHQKGVLHRDLKPANILIDRHGNPKIIDFGIARLIDTRPDAPHTVTGDIVGTPAYMPPEAFEHGVHAVDTRGDVYALGVIIFEMLAGQRPFDTTGLSLSGVGRLISHNAAPLLGTLRPEARGDIEIVVAKALARDPAERYQSAAQLAADLRRVLAHEPILARPTPLLRQARLFARRNRKLVAGASVILLALLLGLAGLIVGLSRARASERRAVAEAQRAQRVADFFLQMVRSANPFQGEAFRGPLSLDPVMRSDSPVRPWPSAARPGKAPGVGDLFAAAAQHLEESFPGEPAMQAELASILSNTVSAIADPRDQDLLQLAVKLLSRAHGPDDPRTMLARSTLLLGRALAGDCVDCVSQLERDIAVLRARSRPEERDLLLRLLKILLVYESDPAVRAKTVALLESVRADMDRVSASDDRFKFEIDLSLVHLRAYGRDPRESLAQMLALIPRARALNNGSRELYLSVLFHLAGYQRDAGDPYGALARVFEGAELSTSVWGGQDVMTYEWWSKMYIHAIMLGELDIAEYAARMQVRGANAMLGPSSLYTTKANGRLARVLLTKGEKLEEAERVARDAVEGLPDNLTRCDGWAVFHEALWAWALRLNGDPQRALGIHREREAAYARPGMHGKIAWAEIIRWAEWAQCEMDLGLREGDLPSRLERIETTLQEAECYVGQLPPDWPTAPLVRRARERFEGLKRP